MVYLAGDIGGTKTHLAFYHLNDTEYKSFVSQKFHSHEYPDLISIVRIFCEKFPQKIKRACFGVAGPIRDNICKATNLPWVIDANKMEKELGIEKIFLINDLEANAYGIKTLKEKDFFTLNAGIEEVKGNQGLISAGTGLGEAGLFYNGEETIPFACEGGHADFAARNEVEMRLFEFLKQKYEHVSYERILSGKGFWELYRFLTQVEKMAKCQLVEECPKDQDPSVIITQQGTEKYDRTCMEVMDLFCSIYGAEAGNLALKYLAISGIYVGGGIAPKILKALQKGGFIENFTKKGRFKELLESIPVKVVLDQETALKGAAYYCIRSK
ncbi:MAG: glucokinase [Simkaniaceae bacterium]|nr:glucokinase [Simkaniaceae bacterium]MCF7851843.1 glucokinase [Simkaniaceae bacterium]